MEEDFLIEQKFGKHESFKVPEGYFDDLTGKIMSHIPQHIGQNSCPIKRFLRPIYWAAACCVVVAVLIVRSFNSIDSNETNHANWLFNDDHISAYSDNIVDEMTDYAMFDNDDFYTFIADE